MQNRCREKKKIGGTTEKKPTETKEKDLDGTVDENGHASGLSGDEHDNSGVKEEISPKRNAERTAKVKVAKYREADDEDDDSIIHGMEMDDDIESDYMGSDSETEKKIKKATAKPKQPRKPKSGTASNGTSPVKKKAPAKKNESDVVIESQKNGDESSSPKNKTEKPKKPRAKKEPGTTPKKETVKKEQKKTAKRPKAADSDDDEDFPVLSDPPTPTKKARTQRGAAAKKSYHISDDEDEDDEDYL